jgi:DNA-binding NarL/FixJ family response regulator
MGSTLVAYSPRADAAFVDVLQRHGIDAAAVASDDLPVAAAANGAAVCVLPLAAGAPALTRIRRAAPACRILVVADGTSEQLTEGTERRVIEALQAGADGLAFVGDPADLVPPLQALLRGESVLPRRVETLLVESVVRRSGRLNRRHAELGLTPAEASVCDLLANDRTTAEIAATLGISAVTVRRHISRAAAKVGVQGRAELVAVLRHSN